jgi:hypothetical protein
MQIGKSFGADALVSDDHEGLGVLVYDHVSGDNAAFYQYLAWSRRVHGDEEGAKSVREVPCLEEYLDHDPIHLSFSGGCAPMKELEETLSSRNARQCKNLRHRLFGERLHADRYR